ncbi:MAG: calcium-binding protein [Thermoleophilaceae bacterium]|nr:calcium-binding protein [Thermoleophilaceae bacterium]
MRKLLPLALVLGALAPASALASTAGVSITRSACNDDTCRYATDFDLATAVLTVAGQPGEANAFSVTRTGGSFAIRDDGAPITAGALCTAVSANEVTCPASVPARSYSFSVSGADGNDTLAIVDTTQAQGFSGGIVSYNLSGGPGDDTITGSSRVDRIDGGDGADRIAGGPGDDELTPGPGANTVDGGEGSDFVDYTGETAAVKVDLADPGPDGPAARDTLVAVENVIGGSGADSLIGDAGPNLLAGERGDDELSGGDGDDDLLGGRGRDLLIAGAGNDQVDVLEADRLGSSDRPRDVSERPQCGSGRDLIVRSDPTDVIDAGCERVVLDASAETPAGYYTVPSQVRRTRGAIALRFKCARAFTTERCRGALVARFRKTKRAGTKRFSVRRGRSATLRVPLNRAARGKQLRLDFSLVSEDIYFSWSIPR